MSPILVHPVATSSQDSDNSEDSCPNHDTCTASENHEVNYADNECGTKTDKFNLPSINEVRNVVSQIVNVVCAVEIVVECVNGIIHQCLTGWQAIPSHYLKSYQRNFYLKLCHI